MQENSLKTTLLERAGLYRVTEKKTQETKRIKVNKVKKVNSKAGCFVFCACAFRGALRG